MRMQDCFFMVDSFNPDLPPEQWSLVYEKRTPGSFSYSASWGKYKIVVSGGAGAGSVISATGSYTQRESYSGINGEKKETSRNVFMNQIEIFSGIVGGGAGASYTDGSSPYFHAGTPGTGYQNGTTGDGTAYGNNSSGAKVCGGSGGGSSSLYINGNLIFSCTGGNGGSCKASGSGTILYGPNGLGGGNGTSGDGSAGGVAVYERATYAVGNPGEDGYIQIYKSNLKPELV